MTMATFLESIKSTVKGKMVLVGPPQTVPVTFNPVPLRREDGDVAALLAAPAAPPPAQAQPQTPAASNSRSPPLSRVR
jgi:hypothetical protein